MLPLRYFLLMLVTHTASLDTVRQKVMVNSPSSDLNAKKIQPLHQKTMPKSVFLHKMSKQLPRFVTIFINNQHKIWPISNYWYQDWRQIRRRRAWKLQHKSDVVWIDLKTKQKVINKHSWPANCPVLSSPGGARTTEHGIVTNNSNRNFPSPQNYIWGSFRPPKSCVVIKPYQQVSWIIYSLI